MTDTPPRSATPEPRTDAGRAAVQYMRNRYPAGTVGRMMVDDWEKTILAIEAEARSVLPSEPPALDVERLAQALMGTPCGADGEISATAWAENIAAAYAALRPPAQSPDREGSE